MSAYFVQLNVTCVYHSLSTNKDFTHTKTVFYFSFPGKFLLSLLCILDLIKS